MPQKTALIIDDDSAVREILKEFLGSEYRTLEAPDGASGLKITDGIKPDLILLDMEMPGIDGIQVCKQLRSKQVLDSTPIIMVTASDQDERRAEALQAGADDLISKPVRKKEFLIRIATQMDLRSKAKSQKAFRFEIHEMGPAAVVSFFGQITREQTGQFASCVREIAEMRTDAVVLDFSRSEIATQGLVYSALSDFQELLRDLPVRLRIVGMTGKMRDILKDCGAVQVEDLSADLEEAVLSLTYS